MLTSKLFKIIFQASICERRHLETDKIFPSTAHIICSMAKINKFLIKKEKGYFIYSEIKK